MQEDYEQNTRTRGGWWCALWLFLSMRTGTSHAEILLLRITATGARNYDYD